MNLLEAKALVESLTYGDGWRFLFDTAGRSIIVSIVAEFPDVDQPERCVVVGDQTAINPTLPGDGFDRDRLLRQVYRVVEEIEAHERLELFRAGGVPVWPPHDGDGLRTSPQPV